MLKVIVAAAEYFPVGLINAESLGVLDVLLADAP